MESLLAHLLKSSFFNKYSKNTVNLGPKNKFNFQDWYIGVDIGSPLPVPVKGFQNSDTLIIEPVPSQEWICDRTYPITWLINEWEMYSEDINVQIRAIKDFSIVSSSTVPYKEGKYNITVDCEELVVDGEYIVTLEYERQSVPNWSAVSYGRIYIREEPTLQPKIGSFAYARFPTGPIDSMSKLQLYLIEASRYQFNIGDAFRLLNTGVWRVELSDFRGIVSPLLVQNLEENIIVLTFRDTVSSSKSNVHYDDWIMNFLFDMIPCDRYIRGCSHGSAIRQGVLYEYLVSQQGIIDAISSIIDNNRSECGFRILVSGHGQGGAIAAVAALDLQTYINEVYKDSNKVYLMSVGALPSGSIGFSEDVMNTIPEHRRHRYVTYFGGDGNIISDEHEENTATGVLVKDEFLDSRNSNDDMTNTGEDNRVPFVGVHLPDLPSCFWRYIKGSVKSCLSLEPPNNGTRINRAYTHAGDDIFWLNGDIIPTLTIDCPDEILELNFSFDVRSSKVDTVEVVHFDEDPLRVQHRAVYGKGPHRLIVEGNNCTMERFTEDRLSPVEQALECHNLYIYADSIYNEDYDYGEDHSIGSGRCIAF